MSDDIGKMSFEQAMAELETVVGKLERGDVPLEESIGLYQRGAELRQHCEKKLKAAEEKVQQILTDGTGAATGVRDVEGL
jgi:exodeoxyribonuclease VII small subunit